MGGDTLDEVLQNLNLGVECWVRVQSWSSSHGKTHHEVGYSKVNGRWGVALRALSELPDGSSELTMDERWPFNAGPRSMRVAAIVRVPDLLEELVKKADKATDKIKEGTELARDVIAIVQAAATEAGVLKKKGAAR